MARNKTAQPSENRLRTTFLPGHTMANSASQTYIPSRVVQSDYPVSLPAPDCAVPSSACCVADASGPLLRLLAHRQ